MSFKRVLLYVWISLLLIVVVFVLLRDGKPSSEWVTKVDLPGKGSLILYKDATADIGESEAGTQKIKVTGKVYIEVPSQEDLTYEIQTEQALIEVTSGTAVIDASIERTTEVTVAEGQIALTSLEARQRRKVQFSAGEKGIISPYAKGIIKKNNRDLNFKSWADFKMTFQNERLEEVILLLQDVYGIQIMLSVPNLSRCKYTGSFDQQPLEDVINALSETFELKVTLTEEESWELVGEGC